MKVNSEGKKKVFDLGRIRTCNLLIRSQTRYPLRHETLLLRETDGHQIIEDSFFVVILEKPGIG